MLNPPGLSGEPSIPNARIGIMYKAAGVLLPFIAVAQYGDFCEVGKLICVNYPISGELVAVVVLEVVE